MKANIRKFDLKIFSGNSNRGDCHYEAEGSSIEWQEYQHIKLPGFDGAVFLSLEAIWKNAIDVKLTSIFLPVIGYETIVKFGATQQLKEQYFVELNIDYES